MSTNKSIKKIAIVRCDRTQESCPGTSCLISFADRIHTFKNYDEKTKLVGFFSCGGCPGRRIFRLIRNLKEESGIDVVHVASCILKEEPFPKCLHKKDIIQSIKKMGVDVVLGSDDKWEKEVKLKEERKKIEAYEENDEILEGASHW
ncbi:MAG: CGGC domain-containing protein [Candidatus Lokiarchaeota archaeon]|nr:CGGC domain-containing protein [Candidatus Lokiarchaeota archaeon]